NPYEDAAEHARPTDPVGQPSTQRTTQSGQDHKSSRAEPGIVWTERKLILKQAGQVNGKGHEPAKREEIEEGEDPGQPLPYQHAEHHPDSLGPRGRRSIARQKGKYNGPADQQHRGATENNLPPDHRRQHRAEKYGCRLADVPQAVESERAPLSL